MSAKKEGRHIEGGEDVRKCEKEKREGPGVQKKKKRKRTAKSSGVVCERDKDKGEDKKTEEDRGPR